LWFSGSCLLGGRQAQVAKATKKRVDAALASPEGQAAQAWGKATAARVMLVGQEAAKVTANRILWAMADQSNWLPAPATINFESGLLLVYRETNNIHSFVPVFTKAHQFLGTFTNDHAEGDAYLDDDDDVEMQDGEGVSGKDERGNRKRRRDVGAEKCANACWMMTRRAIEACAGFRLSGGALIDDASRASCPICRSFVWYETQHSNAKLAGKCFAITSKSWAPAYEPHVTSGVFQASSPPSPL